MVEIDKVIEVAKVLVSPAEKLMNMISGAIGKMYDPVYTRNMAEAKAYEIRTIGQAMRDSSDIPILYDKGNLELDTTDYDTFVKRTQRRMAFQELTKQKNIEGTIEAAYKLLENKEKVPDDPLDADWLLRFFNSVQDVSTEKMQELWAKLLAGEVCKPGTFSLRTLNTLRNISQEEARLFTRIAPFVLTAINDNNNKPQCFLHDNDERTLLVKYGIPFDDILLLHDCGLISDNDNAAIQYRIAPQKTDYIYGNQGRIEFRNNSNGKFIMDIKGYWLTEAGLQLLGVVRDETLNKDAANYLAECLTSIEQEGYTVEGYSGEYTPPTIELITV